VLPTADSEYLEREGLRYEAVVEQQMISLVIFDFELPPGYAPPVADLLVRLPAGFPDASPDMFWVDPEVHYADGQVPAQTQVRQSFRGRVWQRWSRHPVQEWRIGIDNLQTYIRLIRTGLEREAPARFREVA
jgi:hypothetical protein